MISFPSGVGIHLALEPHDMHKSFNDLAAIPLTPEALQLLLDGIDLRGAEMRLWYERG
jgi:hypothetical protein